tara:strand:+ start:38 stop:1345 length:1308 start_codon:yes stop_codon:yes gene_type:complete
MSDNKKKLILISLNELNFDALKLYDLKKFPYLNKITKNFYYTESEKEYSNLEPWIQWLTIYSGLSANEHKVFRLGDVVDKNLTSIFNFVEDLGFKVGIFGSMNLSNNLKNPDFFIPDPWTKTVPDKSKLSKLISDTLSKFVNNNATNKISFIDYAKLGFIFINFFRLKNFFLYFELFIKSFTRKFYKAIFLDLLINDVYIKLLNKNKTQFSNIFFNGAAHIQHHYFLNSKFNKSTLKNPEWYIDQKIDPFFEMLKYYDTILSDYVDNPDFEIIVATGLTQVPYDMEKIYYRLKSHKDFFKKININFKEIHPRMSRDFLVKFDNEIDTLSAEKKLYNIKDNKGESIFGIIENRGKELFITLTYSKKINYGEISNIKGIKDLKNEFSIVALKNGMHFSRGYFFTNMKSFKFSEDNSNAINIKELNHLIKNYFENEKI